MDVDVSSSTSRFGPNMVWVLPLPVWPYANRVQLTPMATLWMWGLCDVGGGSGEGKH